MAEPVFISTFNTENLLHEGVLFAGRDDRAYTKQEFDEKVGWIVRVLNEGRVGLVGFQEQFSEVALKAVCERAELTHYYAPDLEGGKNIRLRADGTQEASGPFVALASKFPILSRHSIAELPPETQNIRLFEDQAGNVVTVPITRFFRPVIRAEVQLRDDFVATVFVAHLKSKRPQFLSKQEEQDAKNNPILATIGSARSLFGRAAEAAGLRQLILNETKNNDRPVILFGDLNDGLSSVTTQMIAGPQPFPGQANAAVLRDTLLYSVHDLEMAESERDVSYTHIFDGRYDVLDHVFVSQELYFRNPQAKLTVRSTRIFNDHLVDSRRTQRDGRGPSMRSDHGVPVTELWWRSQG